MRIVGEKSFPSHKKKKSSIKKPSPPYVLWCKEKWNEVKKANPEADFKEMSSLLASKWKTVTDEKKKPYEEKYKAEEDAYLKIIANEKREHDAMKLLEEEHKKKTAMELLEQYLQFKQDVEKDNKKTKKEKDPLKPKRPMSAYFIFSKEHRAALLAENKNILEVEDYCNEARKNIAEERPGTNNSTINALVSLKWKELSEEERQIRNGKAAEAMETYKKELEAYNKKLEAENNQN
ncbi:High mobility group B protein 13 [Striga hermonthica]|uniref:High mobility group B protein 13 n=1 Tax=Striga hermonthica TaxID=68872 RepID=A0A9N7R8K9_STRHE|nr:High mobility group B protein 13 [Striga hermonthica]